MSESYKAAEYAMSCLIADMVMLYNIRPSVITVARKVLLGAADVIFQ